MSKGSSEPAKFLEMYESRCDVLFFALTRAYSHYTGAAKDIQPLMFVGKGVTFDSGGISLKPAAVSAARLHYVSLPLMMNVSKGHETHARGHGCVFMDCLLVVDIVLMYRPSGGAAAVCAAALAVARLQFPWAFSPLCTARSHDMIPSMKLVVLAPLTENLPGPSANKPGDMCVHPRCTGSIPCIS